MKCYFLFIDDLHTINHKLQLHHKYLPNKYNFNYKCTIY